MEPESRWTYGGFGRRRRPTRTVHVGDVPIGSEHPIRVQSMTTPATRDVRATVDQIERLVDAGCEIVRVTVPTSADADALPDIRAELRRRRVRVPLVADIHFTPAAAMKAVEHVDKIRVNPGNYADKKKFAVREYTDDQYRAELDRIARVFSPLVLRARELGVSMRIGTNHGSLSDRILNRYGDTPEGMVESALEFVRICEAHDYRDLILSMKASNPVVVLQVYRLLAVRMAELGMDYPFHLGVTEAGDGEDGRVKSALGIGTLLAEGIGDTVRVSLTEDPVAEIPVARALVAPFHGGREGDRGIAVPLRRPVTEPRDPFAYRRRPSGAVRVGPHVAGVGHPVLVEVALASAPTDEAAVRRELDAETGPRVPEEVRAEVVGLVAVERTDREPLARLRRALEAVAPRVALSVKVPRAWLADPAEAEAWAAAAHRLEVEIDPVVAPDELRALRDAAAAAGTALLLAASPGTARRDGRVDVEAAVDVAVAAAEADRDAGGGTVLLGLGPGGDVEPLYGYRLLAARLAGAGLEPPLVLLDDPTPRGADRLLGASVTLGGLLCDGIGDAVRVSGAPAREARRIAFGVLQAARVRITRTEFISCPSCGRTLFDLEETTARIKRRTSHLKGVKIAVMGCVVNGPGEMADADFGYVGWGEDKIALFVGKELVARDVPTAEADDRLVELIRRHGRWVDPVAVPED